MAYDPTVPHQSRLGNPVATYIHEDAKTPVSLHGTVDVFDLLI